MTSSDLHTALLRPAVLQILRAAGFNYAKPAVIETVTDLAARYFSLLVSSTAQNAFNNHNEFVPTVQDVRLALIEVGALRPQMSASEEALRAPVLGEGGDLIPFEDLRGVQGFISWAQGPLNKEIRRVAGYGGDEIDVTDIAAGMDEMEDYVTALKKKHSKADDESKYDGTVLGKDAEPQTVSISGGDFENIADWIAKQRNAPANITNRQRSDDAASPATSGFSSAPPTPVEADTQTAS